MFPHSKIWPSKVSKVFIYNSDSDHQDHYCSSASFLLILCVLLCLFDVVGHNILVFDGRNGVSSTLGLWLNCRLHLVILSSRGHQGILDTVHDDVIKWKHFLCYWLFTGEFPAQRPVTRSFDIFFDLCPNRRLSKQSWRWWSATLLRPLWRYYNVCRKARYWTPPSVWFSTREEIFTV